MEFNHAMQTVDDFTRTIYMKGKAVSRREVAIEIVHRTKELKDLSKEHRLYIYQQLYESKAWLELPCKVTVNKVYQSILFRVEYGKQFWFVTVG